MKMTLLMAFCLTGLTVSLVRADEPPPPLPDLSPITSAPTPQSTNPNQRALDILENGVSTEGYIGTNQRNQALWRSAVIPGWGQWYNNQPIKAVIIGGLTWGLLIASIGEGLNKNQTNSDLKLGEKYYEYSNDELICASGFLIFYIYNLVDASKYSSSKNFVLTEPQLHVALLPKGAEVQASLLKF